MLLLTGMFRLLSPEIPRSIMRGQETHDTNTIDSWTQASIRSSFDLKPITARWTSTAIFEVKDRSSSEAGSFTVQQAAKILSRVLSSDAKGLPIALHAY